MLKLTSLCCLIAGSACLGVGGMLLLAAMLPLEGILCILLGICWLLLSEAALNRQNWLTPKQLIFRWLA